MAVQEKQWALVTGASGGLGAEFARALGKRRVNIVLAARSSEPMEQLAAELRDRCNVETAIEVIDLAEPDSAHELARRLDACGIEPQILVNNAAFGLSGRFHEQDPARLRAMLQLDIATLTELTHVYAKRMGARGRGRILLVASLAAFQPTPLLAAYGAAKAYVLSLGEALHIELAPRVSVTVVSPGLMKTGFFEASGYRPKAFLMRGALPPATVAEIGLSAMFAGKSSVVAGRMNRATAFVSRLVPSRFSARMAYRTARD